ncbi:hypothetical protein M3J09_005276 [Ascochyta lentis]
MCRAWVWRMGVRLANASCVLLAVSPAKPPHHHQHRPWEGHMLGTKEPKPTLVCTSDSDGVGDIEWK